MLRSRRRSVLLASALTAVGCGGGSPTTAPAPSAPTPTNASNAMLDAAVLVDAQAPQVSRSDVERVMARAAAKLLEKTGERLRMADYVTGLARGSSVSSMASSYIATTSMNAPEALIVLTNDATSHRFGGYSFSIAPPFAFRNEYASPRSGVGADKVYVAAVEFDHPYARCGYDDAGNRISDVSVGGECRNRPGSPCVQRGTRWMCADSTGDLYADADYFTACTVVHELLHPFGFEANGNLDHYGTEPCRQRTGMTAAEAGDLRLGQLNCQMCPDVYARFRRTP